MSDEELTNAELLELNKRLEALPSGEINSLLREAMQTDWAASRRRLTMGWLVGSREQKWKPIRRGVDDLMQSRTFKSDSLRRWMLQRLREKSGTQPLVGFGGPEASSRSSPSQRA
jgi:hypothetical protein